MPKHGQRRIDRPGRNNPTKSQDMTTVTNAHRDRGPLHATAGMAAGDDDYYVPKKLVDYVTWNRLIGVSDPARLDEAGGEGRYVSAKRAPARASDWDEIPVPQPDRKRSWQAPDRKRSGGRHCIRGGGAEGAMRDCGQMVGTVGAGRRRSQPIKQPPLIRH
jgi:hypothetical protein